MSTPSFKNESVSSNDVSINKIPIANGVPSTGSTLTYDETKNQWVITPSAEYINVQGLVQTFYTTGKQQIKFEDGIKENKTRKYITYNPSTSKWILQPGTYRFSFYCPCIVAHSFNALSAASINIYVSYTSIETGTTYTLQDTGAYWSLSDAKGVFFASCNGVRSTLIIDEPVEAEITIDLNILPADSTTVFLGTDSPETGKPSVLVEQIV